MIKVPFKHIFAVISAVSAGAFFYFEQNSIEASRFEVYSKNLPKAADGLKIVQLSDLHNKKFGRENCRLISEIDKLSPDIILLTGDMVSHKIPDLDGYISFVKKLCKHYPVYYVNGNHECSDMSRAQKEKLDSEMKYSGAVCVDNRTAVFEFRGERINICGLCYDACFYRGVRQFRYGWKAFNIGEMNRLLPKKSEDNFTVLLAHNPLDFDTYAEWGADISFGGHVHGGLIRLPKIGGILSPERRLFPKYKEGVYEIDGRFLAVSRGLGEIRLFNRPEIVCVSLFSGK